jgi:hypothetical protein
MKKLIYHSLSLFFPSLLLFLVPLSISAQAYGTAAGARIGDGFGLTVQHQVALHTTVEGILQRSFKSQDVTLCVLAEQHKSLLSRGFNLYYGAGLYKTWLTERTNVIVQPSDPWGITPIGGLEITLGKFNISGDFKPLLRISGGDENSGGFSWQSAISVRYVFAGRYFKNDDWKFWKKWQKKKK